jgi:hypothetical protein
MPSLGVDWHAAEWLRGRDDVPPAWRRLPAILLNVFATGFREPLHARHRSRIALLLRDPDGNLVEIVAKVS